MHLQWYPKNISLLNKVEDIIVILASKMFNSENFSSHASTVKMHKSLFLHVADKL